jgi:predicted metalloprotease
LHEIGHHVQTLLGTSDKMRQMQEGKSQTEANKLSVALELQADFYAGVWTHYNQQMNTILEDGDIDEALSAAHAVGDDAINLKCKVILFRNLLHTEPLNNANIGL